MRIARPLIAAIVCLTAFTAVPADAAKQDEPLPWPTKIEGHVPVAPGEHPRLVFRKADIDELRRRAATPEGKVMLHRLRVILGGGEHMPDVYNMNPSVNVGPKGPGTLPIDSYTLWHGAGFGLLYQVTGEQKYADLGLQCVDKALAGHVDRDERYSVTQPGGQLRAGPSLRAIALAYDLCYDGWPEADRKRVALAIQDYHGNARADTVAGGIKLENLVKGPRHHPQSNHYGMQVGGGLVALLAIKGDPGLDHARINALIDAGKQNMVKSLVQGHGSSGYYPEGHHTGRMTANGIVPAMQALANVEGEDWSTKNPRAHWLLTKWVYEGVPRADGKGIKTFMRDRYAYNGFNRRGMHARDFAQGWPVTLDEHKPAVLWFYKHMVDPGDPKDFDVTDYPHNAVYVLANWPIGLQEQNPDDLLPRVWADRKCGYFVFRNGWEGPDDIVITAHSGGSKYGAYGTGKGGPVMFLGLGMKGQFPGGFHQSSQSFIHYATDGSALLSSSKIYTHLAVDYSKASGAEAVIVMVGKGAGVEQWANKKGHDLQNKKTGASTTYRVVEVDGLDYHVMTIQSGDAPALEAKDGKLQIGGQTVRYNGKHLELGVFAADGPPAHDPAGSYEPFHNVPLPATKLFEQPPPEEVRAKLLADAVEAAEAGKLKRVLKIRDFMVENHPEAPELEQLKPLVRKLEFAEVKKLHEAKSPKAKKELELFIGRHWETDEAEQAQELLDQMAMDALLGG